MKSSSSRYWSRFAGEALFLYLRLVAKTARWQIEGEEHLAAARACGRPVIWAIWHGQGMLEMAYVDRFVAKGSFALVAVGDKRYEVFSTLAQRTKAGRTYAVNISGGSFASGRALLQVVKAMKEGGEWAIAPDGPDGPAFQAKRGVAYLARKTSAVILPLGAWTRHARRLNRWDHYLVPLPLARIHFVFGPPIPARENMDLIDLLSDVSKALHGARARAQVLAGVTPRP